MYTEKEKERFIINLSESHGIITAACQKTNIARSTYYMWLKDDEEFKEACDAIQEEAIDFVEGKLFERMQGVQIVSGYDKESGEPIVYTQPPSDAALIFYLKCKAKKRGYIEKTEIDLGGTLQIEQITGMRFKQQGNSEG